MQPYTVVYPGKWVRHQDALLGAQPILKYDQLISSMLSAHQISTLSHCVRRKAGAVVICRDSQERRPHIVGWGVNGMPTGEDNCCELPAPEGHAAPTGDPYPDLVTNPRVVHAEIRAIEQALRSGVNPSDMIVLCTDSPCPACAKAIDNIGIPDVFFMFNYHAACSPDTKFRLMRIDPNLVLAQYEANIKHLNNRIATEA